MSAPEQVRSERMVCSRWQRSRTNRRTPVRPAGADCPVGAGASGTSRGISAGCAVVLADKSREPWTAARTSRSSC